MPDDGTKPRTAGRLTGLKNGLISGTLTLRDRLRAFDGVSVEVFAHGILAATGRVALEAADPGQAVAFEIPLPRFPQVDLPCTLTARIAETDEALDSEVAFQSRAELWARMVPFRCRIDGIRQGRLWVRVQGEVAAQVFELREGRGLLGVSESGDVEPDGEVIYPIPLSESLLDGSLHRLSVIHRGSGLPIADEPLQIRLESGTGPALDPQSLISRIEAVERQIEDRYAEVFNSFALQIYRHIDAVTLTQRSNFEREVAALRGLLDLPAPPRPAPDPAETVTISFADPVNGYGVHGIEHGVGGKDFRFVAPSWGLLLPGLPPRPLWLHIQGLRRPFPDVFRTVSVSINGEDLKPALYLNPRSESWNITAPIPGQILRGDSNVLEIELARTETAADRRRNIAAGVLHVTVGPPPGGATETGPAGASAEGRAQVADPVADPAAGPAPAAAGQVGDAGG